MPSPVTKDRIAQAPLIAHVIHRLAVGGLENGLVNLVNQLPPERFRHAIICLTEAGDFSRRLRAPNVSLHALHKREGLDLSVHWRLWRLLRRLRPALVHTRNLATLEMQVIATLAGVRARVHGEHGWDVRDPDGSGRAPRRLRRLARPFVQHYIVLSRHQERYLSEAIGVPERHVSRICNGVDVARFHPAPSGLREAVLPPGFAPPGAPVIGCVMRVQPVKAPLILADAFIDTVRHWPQGEEPPRLLVVGEGPLLPALRARVEMAGLERLVWLPGAREDVPELLRACDCFVLASLAEGICNTILEAMASGLAVIATRVGGNVELVEEGVNGCLVEPGNASALSLALREALTDGARLRDWGRAARARAERDFALDGMVARYQALYADRLGPSAA
ncbi:MAG: TIGR03088 family PEP-CTERM/XrtA system glycosyltransferase [Chromatiaceae bacterium]|nr:TIGR03088 family PEP-CTERM/XrtA system glycosyltransferase [Chromatiaceae bacterium]